MHRRSLSEHGFTLVELLVASVIVVLIMSVTLQITSNTTSISHHTRSRVDTFQESRAAFETMTRHLSQAMLNTYWDYVDAQGKPRDPSLNSFVPKRYVRQSELEFISGPAEDLLQSVKGSNGGALQTATHAVFFQAPLGLSTSASSGNGSATTLLNVSGYFLEFGDDAAFRPRFLQSAAPSALRHRFRLMQMSQPSESLSVYRSISQANQSSQPTAQALRKWFVDPLNDDANASASSGGSQRVKRVLAENIIALIILPKRSDNSGDTTATELAPSYAYDSQQYLLAPGQNVAELTRNQLPPMVQVTMVAIDETSAQRLEGRGSSPSTPPELGLGNLFQTSNNGMQFTADLAQLEHTLNSTVPHITYRVFSTDVSILQAKWSEK